MHWLRIVFVALTVLVTGSLAYARKKDGKNDRLGAVWQFTASNGTNTDSGTFRVHNHEVFKGATKIGRVVPNGALETRIEFSNSPSYTGTAQLKKVKRNDPVWLGEWVRADGSHWTMRVTIKDR